MGLSRKARVFWPLLLTVFLADCSTKRMAVAELSPPGRPHAVIDDVVRFTLAYNQGPAMGLPLHLPIRALGGIALLMVGVLFLWYRRLSPDARALPAALAFVAAGAAGNGWERLLAARGVVDFIDVGLGTYRFWVFNVADIGVTLGAASLALLLWLEGRRAEA